MADQRRSSSLLLTFIVYFSLWPTTTTASVFQLNQCFDECPANHLVSIFDSPCSGRCDTHGYSYYWCYTQDGWGYCSPGENIDYEGNKCQSTCAQYSDGYSCKLSTGHWNTCAPVKPKALTHNTRYIEKCIDDCQYHESGDYFWCHTEKSWDYCSPLPDYTYRGESCRQGHSCGTNSYSYSWCYTSYHDDWDYCGIISPGECSYTDSFRRKRQTNNPSVLCTRRDDDDDDDEEGKRRVTYFLENRERNNIASVNKKLCNEALDLINKWDNQRLNDQSRSNLIRSANFRIDNQGLCKMNNQRCYNLQVQMNKQRSAGESTTVSHIVVPVDTSAEYMRLAFKLSLEKQASVHVQVKDEAAPTSYSNQRCCRRRKH
ncbi:uncharacterized protein LOC131466647 [Solea solea]|uniref:uncharacterized protein LOC131466647 n=1 Tax=Solea solea TaxID=90069 RepID=UPI00272ADB43|nr:uncharacterized protein LOC131466647 [Solea solea]XP_058496025.1 uncharacterized protein LOC131466647 [Solea solea]XP_058496026.1 uncharacterized protein LOC131466647 [Solea solea]